MEHGKWEVGLIGISYLKEYIKRSLLNIFRLDSEEITFPVKHYESVFDRIPQIYEPSINENFVHVFSNYINKYQKQIEEFFNSCRGENSIIVDENLVSYFPARLYNGIEDLAETTINPANCHSSTENVTTKANFNFTQPESEYIYTDIIKRNLVGDSYMRLLTCLHCPSNAGHHSFDYPLYKPVEQSFIELISIRLFMKTGDNVLFEDRDIPCPVILHSKKKSSA